MSKEWVYFLIGIFVSPFLMLLPTAINRAVIEFRRKRILKMVRIEFPDHETIAFVTVDTNDRRAMAKLERQIRDEFNIPEEPTKSFLKQ